MSSEDLSARWARARLAAAKAVVGEVREGADEASVFACAAEVDELELHRRLFENSARLGDGFRKFYRREVRLADLPGLLSCLSVPCLNDGKWIAAEREEAFRFERPPCRKDCTAAVCDAWRECIDGLVVGLTGSARHTRTASLGHGQSTCVDVIYENAESELRYGELDEAIVPVLESVQRFVRMFKGADVRFLGVSEGVLLYQLDTTSCGDLRGNAREMIEGTLKKKLPHLEVRELSPRAVLDPNGEPTNPSSTPEAHP